MARKKKIWSILLILCIALAPVSGYTAGGANHVGSMPMDFADCGMQHGGSGTACDGFACMASAGYCGWQNPGSLPVRALIAPRLGPALAGWRPAAGSFYRSRLDFSIFRPPIA